MSPSRINSPQHTQIIERLRSPLRKPEFERMFTGFLADVPTLTSVQTEDMKGEQLKVAERASLSLWQVVDALPAADLRTIRKAPLFGTDAEAATPIDIAERLVGLDVMLRAVYLAPAAVVPDPELVTGLIFGKHGSADALRNLLVPPRTVTPTAPIPTLDPQFQKKIDRWALSKALSELFSAMGSGGNQRRLFYAWLSACTADTKGISSVSPFICCPGGDLVIRGQNLGTPAAGLHGPANVGILIPKLNGKYHYSNSSSEFKLWSPSEIKIILPTSVGNGRVGFIRTPGPMPPPPNGLAAKEALLAVGQLLGGLGGRTLGVQVSRQAQTLVNGLLSEFANPDYPEPIADPSNAKNTLIFGGNPEIKEFSVNGLDRVDFTYDTDLTFKYQVTAATDIKLTGSLSWIGSNPENKSDAEAKLLNGDPGFPITRLRDALSSLIPRVHITIPEQTTSWSHHISLIWDLADDWDYLITLTASRCGGARASSKTLRLRRIEQEPLFGLADMHAHLVSQYANGTVGFWGDLGAPPRSPAQVNDPSAPGLSIPSPIDSRSVSLANSKETEHGPPFMLPAKDITSLFKELYFNGFNGATSHVGGGWPDFLVWPRPDDLGHQQAHISWIRRAYDGGMRLIACLAVNSEFASRRFIDSYIFFGSQRPGLSTVDISDKAAVERQILAIHQMVKWVSVHDGGWMEVAQTSDDAERIVRAGRLAIVIGVEVGSLGGWHKPEDLRDEALKLGKTTDALIQDLVDWLHGLGVRYVFPVHGINNAFGGTAVWMRMYDAANLKITNEQLKVESAPKGSGIGFRLDQDTFLGSTDAMDVVAQYLSYFDVSFLLGQIALTSGQDGGPVSAIIKILNVLSSEDPQTAMASLTGLQLPIDSTWKSSRGGHINAMGLTDYGAVLIRKLAQRGMIIDIDHMGFHTTNSTIDLCEKLDYPIVAGHADMAELKFKPKLLPSDHTLTNADPRESWIEKDLEFDRTINAARFGTANAKRLVNERDRTADQLRRIRALGGMVGTFVNHGDGLSCRCGDASLWRPDWRVPNDANGTTKSFAQNYEYLTWHLRGRRSSFGTDVNGGAALPLPRFGPNGARGSIAELDRVVRSSSPNRIGIAPTRAEQVFRQQRPVVYNMGTTEWRRARWITEGLDMPPKDTDKYQDRAYDWVQVCFWEALCAHDAGEQAFRFPPVQPPFHLLPFNIIQSFRLGLAWTADDPGPLIKSYFSYYLELAAYWAFNKPEDTFPENPPAQVYPYLNISDILQQLRAVVKQWRALKDGAVANNPYLFEKLKANGSDSLYTVDGKMRKHTIGSISDLSGKPPRDFDVNTDGVSHYGLLPDYFQDLSNIGVPNEGIDSLYRGAGDFVRMWSRCERRARELKGS